MNPPSLLHTLTHYGTRSRYRCTTLDPHAAWPSPSQLVRRFLALRNGLLLTGLFCLLWGVGQGQTIRYVKPSATGTGTGSSWANASGDLQAMINASQAGDQVWVATGLYTPTTGTNRNVSFSIPSGVALYGGFVGTESSVSQRPLINPVNGQPSSTTLSGNIGDGATAADNTYSVVRLRNASAQTRLDGLVITGGNANGSFPNEDGGGIRNDGSGGGSSSNPTLVNLSLVANQAAGLGGGLFNNGGNGGSSSPVLTNISFVGNSASFGGGLQNRGAVQGSCSPVLTNVSFVGNSVTSNGGAINNSGVQGSCNPVLTNVSFVGNSAAGNGGAIFSGGGQNNGNSQLTNVSFQANTAQQGRAVLVLDASLSLTNSIIVNNGLDNAINSINSGPITARFCLFEAGLTGYTTDPSNLTTTSNPFVSTSSTQLNACSEAIDAGDNAVEAGSTDLAGNNRRVRTIDIGAYEFQDDPATLAITQPPASASAVCVGTPVSVSVGVIGSSSTYQWYKDGTTLANQTAATLSLPNTTTANAGRYSVVVTGTCNSLTSTAFSLTVNPTPSVSISPSTAAICAGQTATLTASGADTYRWSTGETTAAISVSATGTYALTATTSAGCSATATSTVTGLVLGGSATDVSCFGGFDGQATVTVTGGSGDYSYSWSPSGGTAPTARNLSPGRYTVTVYDNRSNCLAERSFTIGQPSALTSSLSLTNVSTFGGQDGAARLVVSGGTPPYGYNWEPGTPPGESTSAVSGLVAGDYSVIVTDDRQCSLTRSFTISQPAAPPTITDFRPSAASVCVGTTLVFTATLGNVGVSYSYTLTVGDSQLSGTSSQQPFSQSLTVAGLGPQTASLSVSTVNGQASVKTVVRVNALPSVSISPSTTAICEGQQATLTALGASSYQWHGPGGFTSSQAIISVSTPGSYSVTGTTSEGCSGTATATLSVNALPQASLTSNGPLSCTQTSVSLSAGPAAQDGQPFTYVFSGPGFSQSGTANTASVSQPGTYSLTVTSAAGCSASAATTVTGATALTITQPPTSQTACVGTSVTFAVQAQGPQGLTYAWFKNSADPSQPVLATTPTYEVNVNEGGKAGRYIVRVSAPGCASQQTEARLTVNQRPVAPPPTSTRRQLCPSPTPVELSQYVNRTNASYQLRYSTEPGQALNGSQVVLNQPGSYAYQVTQLDPATGCESVPTRFILTVNATIQLVSLPPAQSVCSGSDLTLTVQASGTNLRYEWFRGSISNLNKLADNPSQQTGTTTASLKLIRVSQSESYFVRISGECGVVSSEAIPVTVQACGARQGVGEATRGLQVVVLGNPVAGQTVEVEVRGAQDQPLRLQLIDQRGQLVDDLARPAAQAVESVRLRLGQVAGLYLLRVATPTQRQTVKVVKH